MKICRFKGFTLAMSGLLATTALLPQNEAYADKSVSANSLSVVCALPPTNEIADRLLAKSETKSRKRMAYHAKKAAKELLDDKRLMSNEGYESHVLANPEIILRMNDREDIFVAFLNDEEKGLFIKSLGKDKVQKSDKMDWEFSQEMSVKKRLGVDFFKRNPSSARRLIDGETKYEYLKRHRQAYMFRFVALDESDDIYVFNKRPDLLEVKQRSEQHDGNYISKLYFCVHEDEDLRQEL